MKTIELKSYRGKKVFDFIYSNHVLEKYVSKNTVYFDIVCGNFNIVSGVTSQTLNVLGDLEEIEVEKVTLDIYQYDDHTSYNYIIDVDFNDLCFYIKAVNE